MTDLGFAVKVSDLGSEVLEKFGTNVQSLGKSASSAFSSISSESARFAQQAQTVTQSNTMIFAGGAGLSLVAGALTTIAGAGIAAVSSVAAFGVAATSAADRAERDLGKVTEKLRLIEAQRLNVSVDLVGKESLDEFSTRIKTTADELERMTLQKSSKFVALSKDAVMLGISPEKVDEAVQAAAGLAYAFGTSLEGGLSKANAAMEGSFSAFENLIPGIEKLSTDEEKLAAVSKLAADALQLQSNGVNDSISVFSRFNIGFGNLLENVGSGKPMFETFSGVLNDIVFPAIDTFDTKIFDLGDSAESLKDSFRSSMAYVATVVELYTDQASASFQKLTLQINLSIETAINRSRFMMNNLGNYATQLKNMFFGIPDLIKAGSFGPGAFFIKQNELTPDALKRGPEKSEFEKQLEKMIRDLSSLANREFDDLLKDNLAKIDALTNSNRRKFNPGLDPKPDQDSLTPKLLSETKNIAVESRVMTRGPGNDPLSAMVQKQNEQIALLKLQLEVQQRQAQDAAVMANVAASTRNAPLKESLQVELVN